MSIKGTLGKFSKIKEEFDKLIDAHFQYNKILELCKVADLLGAIEAYTVNHYNMRVEDIYKMTELTRKAFEDGTRKSNERGNNGESTPEQYTGVQHNEVLGRVSRATRSTSEVY